MQMNAQLVKSVLPLAIGAVLDVVGKVEKVVKREGQFKLVIKPDSAPGFVVFADCLTDAENLIKHKVRKGSVLAIRGKFQTYSTRAFCLSDCRLADYQPPGKVRTSLDKKRKMQNLTKPDNLIGEKQETW